MKRTQPKLVQTLQTPSRRVIDARSAWIWVFPQPLDRSVKSSIPYARQLLQRIRLAGLKKGDTGPVILDLPNPRSTHVACAAVKPDMEAFALLTLACKLVAAHDLNTTDAIAVMVHGFDDPAAERIYEAIIAAGCAAAAEMPDFKSKGKQTPKLKSLELHGIRTRHGFKRTLAEMEGNTVTRYLSMLPSNMLTPALYLEKVKDLATSYGWKLTFLDKKRLQKEKAGAFLAVCQGSSSDDAGIVHLQYRPQKKTGAKSVALVGKGICYDTGGHNLKTGKYMFGMHEDMQGSAVALGILVALTRMKVNFPVDCWLALAMNHIGPDAYKPNDVITAGDGTTIEIINTDAEGRMVLADTLLIATRERPGLLIDYATLTGACVYALGTAYCGVFSNRREYTPVLIEAGRASGERVWPFPMDDDYDKAIESKIADVKQCAPEGMADHIIASRFLQRFIKYNTPWVHVDLAAMNNKGGLGHIPTDTIGFGIRFTVNLLLDQKL